MTRDDGSQNSNDGNGDDLTAIKGIGKARRQLLSKALDVHTFADLAALTVDEIETALQAETGPTVSRSGIGAWIKQAHKLASDRASKRKVEAPLEPEAETASTPSAETPPATEPDIEVQVTDVRVRQPLGAGEPIRVGEPGQSFRGVVSSAEPFELGVTFEVTGSDASSKTGERAPFTAEFRARDLRTGTTLELGRPIPGTRIEGTSSFVATLSSAKLPQGAYRMRVLVSLQSAPLPVHSEARLLRVL